MKPEWFQKATIPYDQMWSDDRFWLAQVLDGHKISADFTLDRNDEIVSHNVVIVDDLTLPFEPVVSS